MTANAKPGPDKPGPDKPGQETNRPEAARGAAGKPATVPPKREMPLPGLAAISLYMLVLAGTAIVGVAEGHMPALYLFFSAAFVTAGLGLMLMLRWAWALTLAAVLLLAAVFFWRFSAGHQLPYIVQGLLNLVFFFYLVRAEVREKLR
jgi:lysylphosphatidylglycerol synthetase-like protein (DUF2156 family)